MMSSSVSSSSRDGRRRSWRSGQRLPEKERHALEVHWKSTKKIDTEKVCKVKIEQHFEEDNEKTHNPGSFGSS